MLGAPINVKSFYRKSDETLLPFTAVPDSLAASSVGESKGPS